MSTAMTLAQSKRSRATRRTYINKILDQLDLEVKAKDADAVELTLAKLLDKELVLIDTNQKLENATTDPDELEVEIDDNQNYSDKIIEAKIAANRFLNPISSRGSAFPAVSGSGKNMTSAKSVKLPKLQIGKFDGQLMDWERFFEQFESGVDSNLTISKIDKFNYLRTFLTGPAALTIEGLSLTEANYDIAMDLLKDKYGKKEVLVNQHVHQLLNIRPVQMSKDARDLRRLLEEFNRHLRALQALGTDVSTMGVLLCPILKQSIPHSLLLEWNRQSTAPHATDLKKILDFLKKELEGIEDSWRTRMLQDSTTSSSPCKSERKDSKDKRASANSSPIDVASASSLVATNEPQSRQPDNKRRIIPYCIFCEIRAHKTSQCPTAKTNDLRREALRRSKRCFRCFSKDHAANSCSKELVCRICRQPHHTLLCNGRSSESASTHSKVPDSSAYSIVASSPSKAATSTACSTVSSTPNNAMSTGSESVHSTVASTVNHTQVARHQAAAKEGIPILQVLKVWICHPEGDFPVNCLIDNGSERSFLLSSISQRLQLPHIAEESLQINSFGGFTHKQKVKRIPLHLKGANGVTRKIEVYEVEDICAKVGMWEASKIEMLLQNPHRYPWSQLMGVAKAAHVDLLIGADHYWEIVTGHMKRLTAQLMATETVFGWVLLGQAHAYSYHSQVVTLCTSIKGSQDTIEHSHIPPFWELDRTGIMEKENRMEWTLEEQEGLTHFEATTTFSNGRYQVNIPWNESKNQICLNLGTAEERLKKLLFRLHKDPELFTRYQQGIYDYLEAGHTEEVSLEQESNGPIYYMPHHPVIKEDRKTTKLRIVFDASSHSKGHFSLNDCQFTGPNLNPNIFTLLLRFRRFQIGLSSDVEKAFLQIELHHEDRDATRFLWLDSPSAMHNATPKYRVFRMTRVLFGMKASPFLLAATIRLHAKRHGQEEPEIANLLNENMYVDDLLTGAPSTEMAYQVYDGTNTLMAKGGFLLKKWATNDLDLRNRWIKEGVISATEPIELLKVLGMMWDPSTDQLAFKTNHIMEISKNPTNTKRGVLQLLATLFDPLGFLSPKLVTARCLFQDLWRMDSKWDDKLPEPQNQEWQKWVADLPHLIDIKQPRWCNTTEDWNTTQLHLFCDASPKAYGCVAYIRIKHSDMEVTSTLLASKARIAPLHPMSIPRLELLACLIGARLAKTIKEAWNAPTLPTFFWSDSQVALQWINSVPRQWKIFVARRIQEVQALTLKEAWMYCPSKDNVADIITHGQSLEQLQKKSIWWNGPQWLTQDSACWPQQTHNKRVSNPEALKEEINVTQTATITVSSTIQPLLKVEEFSSWMHLIRVTAWILRFVKNCSIRKQGKRLGHLTCQELKEAEHHWFLVLQSEQFLKEKTALLQNKEIEKSSSIFSFHPYLDKQHLIRLGGRLNLAPFKEYTKHPILLRAGSPLMDLLILDRHMKTLHGGVQSTLIKLREEVWLLRGRQAIRKVVQRCMKCRRWNVKPAEQIEAPLPADRLNCTRPFEITGLDFAGPVWVKQGDLRSKGYICLFTCAVTRALHLELTSSQGIKPFLLALRRFIARRGCCRTIYSDNAQTFRQADRLIRASWENTTQAEVQDYVASVMVEWKFIPPRAAWWGGFYERMVGSVKRHLRRTLGQALLDAEELSTILIEIEAIINARPLTTITEDPIDNASLTPFHFLIGENGGTFQDIIPGMLNQAAQAPLRRRWQYRRRLMEGFWKRWKQEYILQLQTAHQVASTRKESTFRIGDVVLLKEEKLPRGQWKMARITEVTPGRDGKIRSVMVKTSRGDLFRRAIQHICPMELDLTTIT